jgi:7,8-dihydroneopterin aldolase/epimerase/oxygenase
MDIIFISELRIETLVGIYDWERKIPQTVQFDLEIGIPDTGRARTDKIAETIDYAKVVGRISEMLKENHFLLLERMAESIAQLVLKEFGAPWVKISVAKLSALKNVKRLGVVIERGKKS